MAHKYNPRQIEEKWQNIWPQERESYKLRPGKEKYYCLDMFSYPSSEGLHVGHWRPYMIADVWTRYQTMLSKQVLHPVGFDAFGLPAENAAIKTKVHPAEYTAKSIVNFTRQLKQASVMYDWSTVTITSSPEYYQWTQWIFLQLYKNGLAYRKAALVNWCPSCQTVLANEQVISGRCERCGTEVTKKELKQWFFKITDFADELLNFEGLNWPERVKTLQTNWIGKSEGAEIHFTVADAGREITVFTTRPDTLMGATYLVLAPEHPLLSAIVSSDQKEAVDTYIESAKKKTEIDRLAEDRRKTGVFTGADAIHPISGAKIPIWVADYVIGSYGTGAVMGVPAHDTRDFEFTKDYNLPIIFVIKPEGKELDVSQAYIGDGIMIHSGTFDGMSNTQGGKAIVSALEKENKGHWTIQYRLRDWLVSRQRYWGAPIPIIYCEHCGEQPVPEQDLPIELPEDVAFMPTGASPLERHPSFKQAGCPKCSGNATRETDTLDTFVDSSWYYLRYTSPKSDTKAFDYDQVKTWLPVDFYIGGIEHATLHLLYARFMMKALHRIGLVPYDEPFKMFFGNGMIYLHGQKMSKSKGNVVNPDEMVQKYGTDALRGYILFMGPADQDVEWQTGGINGVRRFLERAWDYFHRTNSAGEDGPVSLSIRRANAAMNELLPQLHFNRCISTLMIALNELDNQTLNKQEAEVFIQLFAPFFPHFAEEIWSFLGHPSSIFDSQWPKLEIEEKEPVVYAIQVNGKFRGTVTVPPLTSEEETVAQARAFIATKDQLDEKNIAKTIFVAGRIVNFVVE